MLKITIPAGEMYDEKTEMFVETKEQTLKLEHSLVSLSKWESKWHKPFISSKKSYVEIVDYIRCMTITQNVDQNVYLFLTNKNVSDVNDYIENPMTATTIAEMNNKGRSKEIVTAELIYYWMIALQIPFECQKWHLNRLLTLIKVCNVKNGPAKKMSRSEHAAWMAAQNKIRRQKSGSKG